jgi:hypothetical protein
MNDDMSNRRWRHGKRCHAASDGKLSAASRTGAATAEV